jgi:hypothetical protein
MVIARAKDERFAVSRARIPRTLQLGLALGLAAATACVSQGGPSTRTAHMAEQLKNSPPTEPEDPPKRGRPSNDSDYYLHIAGIVECRGFLWKSQTSYGEAWATHPGEDGPRVEVSELELGIEYLDGLFSGLRQKKVGRGKLTVRGSDVLRGNVKSDPCGCVRFVASGVVSRLVGKLRARLKVCPDS